VLRALQLSRKSSNDHRRLLATRAGDKHSGLSATDPVLKRIEAERDERPAIAGATLTPPSITERLAIAESFVRRHADSHEALIAYWQLASRLAHGPRHALWQVSDARMRGLDHVGFQAVVTGDIVALTAHYEAAINYIEDGVMMLEARGSIG
jgi:hypothetical protein